MDALICNVICYDANMLWQTLAVGVILAVVAFIMIRRILRGRFRRRAERAPDICAGCAFADACHENSSRERHASCPQDHRRGGSCACS